MRMGIVVILLGIIIAGAPLVVSGVAGNIAESNGCLLNEGGINPCEIAGKDRGELLGAMFVAGWFFIYTVPIGGVLAAIGALWFVIAGVRRLFFRRDRGVA